MKETIETPVLEILKSSRTDYFMLDPLEIVVEEEFNLREDFGDENEWNEFVGSIREIGVQMPLKGYKKDGLYILTDGHRRHRAAMLLRNEGAEIRIPFVTDKSPNLEQRVITMLIANDGKPLNAIELAEGIQRLKNFGLNPKEIAKKIGKTEAYISNMGKIASLPTKLKNKIKGGDIASTTVLNLLRKNDNLTAEDIIEKLEAPAQQSEVETGTKTKKLTEGKFNSEKGIYNSWGFVKKLTAKLDESDVEDPTVLIALKKIVNGDMSHEDLLEFLEVKQLV